MSSITTARRPRATSLLVALAVCAAAVCAVGASTANAAASAPGSAKLCVRSAIAPAVAKAGKAQGTTAKLGTAGFKCAGGWAYANADLGPAKHGIAVTFVFADVGSKWVLKSRAAVCKTPGTILPVALYKGACSSN